MKKLLFVSILVAVAAAGYLMMRRGAAEVLPGVTKTIYIDKAIAGQEKLLKEANSKGFDLTDKAENADVSFTLSAQGEKPAYTFLLVSGLRSKPLSLSKTQYKRIGSARAVYALDSDRELIKRVIDSPKVVYVSNGDELAKKLGRQRSSLGIIREDEKSVATRAVLIDGKNPIISPRLNPLKLYLKIEAASDVGSSVLDELFPNRQTVTTFKAVGDIVLGRTVIRNMQRFGWCSPFNHVNGWLKSADITFGNLENAVSDRFYSPPAPHTMRFVSPSKGLCGLKSADIDLVSLANNHSMNAGTGGVVDSVNHLKKSGIISVGAGKNSREAHAHKIIEKYGTKFAFLGYNTITGGVSAGKDSPGLAQVNIRPWFPYSKRHADAMVNDIKKAKADSDFVTVIYHWGTEYVRKPNAEQRKIARLAITAGADLIVGVHSHWVQGFETYKGKLIAYSLGNFVFDQSWSRDTEEGVAMEAVLLGDKLVDVQFSPFAINLQNQPKFNSGTKRGDKILRDLYTLPY